MERLRIQGMVQRLRRQWGDEEAWAIVSEAFEIELRQIRKLPAKKPVSLTPAK
jgi:hypothetical protein